MNRYVALMALVGANLASAGVIVQNLGGNAPGGSGAYFGESFTTPSGGPWDDLAFNFYSDAPPATLLAGGTAFLLTMQYLGTPSALGASTPGFVAESTGISGGQYIFAPGVEVLPGTTYWVYENGAIGASGGNAVSGDVAYYTPSASSDFVALSEETGVANFTLDGTVAGVPEPATVGTLLGGLAVLAAVRCRKRRAGIGAT